MCRRGSSDNISDQAFIPSTYGEVHIKAIVRTPMPIEQTVSSIGMPVEIGCFPELGYAVAKIFFDISVFFKIGSCRKQSHHQVGSFYNVCSIIQPAKGNRFPSGSIHKMRKYSM